MTSESRSVNGLDATALRCCPVTNGRHKVILGQGKRGPILSSTTLSIAKSVDGKHAGEDEQAICLEFPNMTSVNSNGGRRCARIPVTCVSCKRT